MTIFLFVAGLVLLVAGAEALVRGASRIAAAAGISPLVIGLTVVAFGTSAPELAVTMSASLRGDPDLAVGNAVGSNISNVLLILGLSALVAPLLVQRSLIRLEVPLMIGVSALFLVITGNGMLGRVEGVVLVAVGATYVALLVRHATRAGPATEGVIPGSATTAPPARVRLGIEAVFAVAGLLLLLVGSRWLVDGARTFAEALGVSELVIGLTIVAVGTSLPELATSVVATIRGARDIAVGNVVGSNLFNLLFVLGLAATAAPGGLPVPAAAIAFDIPVMVLVAVVCLPVFFTGREISRWEGTLFLSYFVAYTAYVLLAAARHEALHLLQDGLLFFAIPMTVVTLGLITARELLAERP